MEMRTKQQIKNHTATQKGMGGWARGQLKWYSENKTRKQTNANQPNEGP